MSSIPASEVVVGGVRSAGMSLALSLGRVEGRKLLRHPVSMVGAAASLMIPVLMSWNKVPVLNRWDAHTNEALIPFAAAVLIAAQLGTMRARRNGTTELFVTAPAREESVVGAHLLAVTHAVVGATLIVLVHLVYLKIAGGVTSPRWHVLFIGPALVGFAGAMGVAVGRWAPRLFAAPVTIAGLVALSTVLSTNSYAHNREWLSLWAPSEVLQGVAGEVTLRPYGWRLIYLLGLMLAAALVALAQLRQRRVIAIAALVVISLVVAVAGDNLMERVPRADQRELAAAFIERLEHPRCTDSEGIEYCPVEGYAPWIDLWQGPVQGVTAASPEGSVPAELRLLQAPTGNELYDERANIALVRAIERERRRGILAVGTDIRPALSWGRNSSRGSSEIALALEVAARVTGIDARFRITKQDISEMPQRHRRHYDPALYTSCTTIDQGRSLVAMWLAAQATDPSRAAFESALMQNPFLPGGPPGENTFFDPHQWALNVYSWESLGDGPVMWGTRESAYVADLLERPPDTVTALIAEHWDRVADRTTTTDEAAALLGLQRLPSLASAMKEWNISTRDVGLFGVPACR